jgi:hypothetical protein
MADYKALTVMISRNTSKQGKRAECAILYKSHMDCLRTELWLEQHVCLKCEDLNMIKNKGLKQI